MVKQTIKIFARVKPTKSRAGLYDVDEDDEAIPRLTLCVPRDMKDGFVNNKKETYKFRFERVFDQQAKQDEIFEHVAKPVADNILEGYNGTIFAYGQTGSGKTFTITGGAERYSDRGIIPRTLSYLYEMFEQDSERTYTLHVSYLEIYNEGGYDLLDPKHEAAKLEDLPKVALMEDSDQNIHLKNLSVHAAANEEEALNLLFLGDTNRMIAETPMNQASTRSHCVFTIHVTSRESGSATIRRSKLHLVDLAGSERVHKTGVNGVLLTEAKYINLSLHFLEQVITSLADKNRQHIPYRNSMMTSVLRDSLGGNCMTTMIATCSVEKRNIDESISTCRFAQRVAMIKNDVMVNEELDPKLMIQRLKREVQTLKEELALATGEQRTDALTDEELDRCREAVSAYVTDTDPDAILSIGADMRKIQACFSILKKLVLDKPKVKEVERTPRSSRIENVGPPPEPPDTGPYSDTENNRLKELVQQRDNEINILVNMLKKEKKRAQDAISELESFGQLPRQSSSASESSMANSRSNSRNQLSPEKSRKMSQSEERTKKKILGDMSVGRQEAFEIFRRDYYNNPTIEENKLNLKQRYTEAKSLGEAVNKSRQKINHVKGQIEQHRMQLAMQGLVDGTDQEIDEVEQELRDEMEEEKLRYKENFSRLRTLKTEIEHLQHLLEKSKVKLMKDFEIWFAEQAALNQEPNSTTGRSAWRTPTPKNRREGTYSINPERTYVANSANQERAHLTSSSSEKDLSHQHPSSGRRQKVSSSITNSFNNLRPLPPTHNGNSSGGEDSAAVNGYRTKKNNIPMTGDPKADADIMAFIKARQNILRKAQLDQR
ncbi:kinesin-like protein KIF6 [Saccostrea echinata]|uniref:kinesin-like protein KIF6 n=1 Tax=Saccostrea echinata TaxID=191078 RepID=UPI002A803BA5|nr:kinesin-like protein KIF6 [Saccostrea echinata]